MDLAYIAVTIPGKIASTSQPATEATQTLVLATAIESIAECGRGAEIRTLSGARLFVRESPADIIALQREAASWSALAAAGDKLQRAYDDLPEGMREELEQRSRRTGEAP